MTWPDQPRSPNYDPRPRIPVPGEAFSGHSLWRAVAAEASRRRPGAPVLALDCYPGVDLAALERDLAEALPAYRVVDCESAALPIESIDARIADNLTDDRVFGVLSHHVVTDFYDAAALDRLRAEVDDAPGPVVLIGWGSALVAPAGAVVVLVDVTRWEIQLRYRRGAGNWRKGNGGEDQLRKYKRGFFVEWRVADRHKHAIWPRLDWIVDGSATSFAGVRSDDLTAALDVVAGRPFRLVPYVDQGVWGGQWMKEVLGLDPGTPNYAWCFDCVPEENSLLFDFGGVEVELPAMDLVRERPRALLGERTYARFGAEFPIRFDFLDTMHGGNLSLQVHPLTDYIQDRFGMHYTQDESYYLLDASDDAVVYLGLRDDVDPAEFEALLRRAAAGEIEFPAADLINTFPARRHDHFLIPAGTVHCSGANSMVLEISATPYIFTFKMWDWGRVGLDGVPRPVHLDHALANIRWERRHDFARDELCNRIRPVAHGEGWREESTGLHELEFIETRRHWSQGPVDHDTRGTVNVLNLVHGAAAVVTSPDDAFPPATIHYAETFVVPAAVGRYVITPADGVSEIATLKASVRHTERDLRDGRHEAHTSTDAPVPMLSRQAPSSR